jgi:hypothetical protein
MERFSGVDANLFAPWRGLFSVVKVGLAVSRFAH